MEGDERAIYVVLVIAGILPVLGALLDGGNVGAGVTVCVLMTAVGVLGLSGRFRRPMPTARLRRPPRARSR